MCAWIAPSTFSFLRPNELVWNYVAGNYLMGEMPAAFDILYWNSDSTNLPGPFYAWYLRNIMHLSKPIYTHLIVIVNVRNPLTISNG